MIAVVIVAAIVAAGLAVCALLRRTKAALPPPIQLVPLPKPPPLIVPNEEPALRRRILEAIAEQNAYELAHHERRFRPGTDQTLPVTVHYTSPQRREAIRQRIERAYYFAGQPMPEGVAKAIKQAVGDE